VLSESDRNNIVRALVEVSGDRPTACSATDISQHLLTKRGVHVHWKTIQTMLRGSKDLAKASKRNGRWVFTPLKSSFDQARGADDSIQLVDSSKAVIATVQLHDTLAALSGLIRFCDPYLDQKTLRHLDAVPNGTTLRLLSYNVTDNGTTRSLVQAFGTKGVTLEIKKAHANVLHDRYLIAANEVLILGTSLNGFGKKQCFIVRAGQSIAGALTATFDNLWASGTTWP
jgi:hypothetical protein